MSQQSFLVEYSFFPGSFDRFFLRSSEAVREAFQEAVPASRERRTEGLVDSDGTVLQIIITGASLGAGIVAAEMLKALAGDLWAAIKRLILSKADRSHTDSSDPGDTLEIELNVGSFSMWESLSDLDQRSDGEIRDFIEGELTRMYSVYSWSVAQKKAGAKGRKDGDPQV